MDISSFNQLSLAKTTKQSLFCLIFDLIGILAGLIVASSLYLFSLEPWIIILYPGILSMRGVVGGLFSGRLSTGLHLGTIKTKIIGNDEENLHSLWGSIVVLTLESSILLGFVTFVFSVIFLGTSLFNGLIILGVLIATMGLSLVTISPITISVAFSSFKRGLDPDIIVYPIISTVADILVTVCYFIILYFYFFNRIGFMIIFIICCVFTFSSLYILIRRKSDKEFMKTLREALYTIFVVAFIVNITGSLLSKISGIIGRRQEVYLVYPALINTIGDVGAIIGSTATTKLALGSIYSSFKSIKDHKNQIIGTWCASLLVYMLLAILSSLYTIQIYPLATVRFIILLLSTNVCAVFFMIFISFGVAIATFRKGLNPDNFVIPIESSLADTITTVSLLVMLSIIG